VLAGRKNSAGCDERQSGDESPHSKAGNGHVEPDSMNDAARWTSAPYLLEHVE